MPMIEFITPIITVSEANSSEHWLKKSKRHKLQKKWIWIYWKKQNYTVKTPCVITLTRIGGRKLDVGDNLPMSLKYVRDAISEMIHPNLPPGKADDDPLITWLYNQEPGDFKGVKINIEY